MHKLLFHTAVTMPPGSCELFCEKRHMIQKQGLQLHAFGCPTTPLDVKDSALADSRTHIFCIEHLNPNDSSNSHEIISGYVRESFCIKIMLIGRSLMILRRLGFVRSFLVSPNVVNIPTLGGSASIIN